MYVCIFFILVRIPYCPNRKTMHVCIVASHIPMHIHTVYIYIYTVVPTCCMCYGSLPISYTHVYSTCVCITHASGEHQDTTCTVLYRAVHTACMQQVHEFTGYRV